MRKVLKAALPLFAMLLNACAAAPGAPRAVAPQTVRGSGELGNLRIAPSSGTESIQLPYTVEQVWAVLPAAFDSLAVPVATIDPVQHRFGNEGFKLRQRLGKTTLSRLFDCGETQIGPNADSYDVFLVVVAQLTAGSAGTSSLSTTVEASAKSIANAQNYTTCSSKGSLEARLTNLIKAGLAK